MIRLLSYGFALVALLLTSSYLGAHEVRPALLTLKQTDATTWHATFRQPQVNGRFLNLEPALNCAQEETGRLANRSFLETTFVLVCGEEGLQSVEIKGLQRTLVDTLVRIEVPGSEPVHHLIGPQKPVISVARETLAVPAYLRLGVTHLLFGLDHVLFVLLLLFLAKGWVSLIKVVTSFTIAHSITLACSVLGILVPSQAPVEALIALSIVLLAREVLMPAKSLIGTRLWVITFFFGLLHGFGFAGSLLDIGLQEEVVLPLFLFNVGVEIGQLLILGIVAAFLFLLRKTRLTSTRPAPKWLLMTPVYLAGGVGFYLFLQNLNLVLDAPVLTHLASGLLG